MRHWFINPDSPAPAYWRECFPRAEVLERSQLFLLTGALAGMVWYRLAADDQVEEAMAELRRHTPLPVVIMSNVPADAEAARAVAAGASGYCNSHAAPEVLGQIALVVENGGFWLGQSLLQRLVRGTSMLLAEHPPASSEPWAEKLSEREREVAAAVARGASNKEIARELAITERTVKAHLGAIFEKLGVRDRLHLSLRVNGFHE